MKQNDLVQGKKYQLKYTHEFCHLISWGERDSKGFIDGEYIFVGKIDVEHGQRNIFYSSENNSSYAMFSCSTLEYIIDEKEFLLKKFINENNIDRKIIDSVLSNLKK
jgi:hypothetical protein